MLRHFVSLFAFASLLTALGSRPLSAGTVTLSSVRDNTLFEDADGDTSNGAGPVLFAGRNAQNLTRRALLTFDIAGGIPTGASIDSVVLTLRVSSAPDSIQRLFELHRVLADWGEGQSSSEGGGGAPATPGDATWLHTFFPGQFWAAPGGDFDPTASASAMVGDVGPYIWTGSGLTADVQFWLDQPQSNFGWLIQGEESGSRTVRRFDSRENSAAENRPALTIYFSLTNASRPTSWGNVKALYK